jgi:hypothetical protein
VTAPSVFVRQLTLLEVIAELSNGHEARMRWPSTRVQLQSQSRDRHARNTLITVLLDCADKLVRALPARRIGLSPQELTDYDRQRRASIDVVVSRAGKDSQLRHRPHRSV